MLKSSPPYAIWSIWLYLPILQKLLFLVLCMVGIYSLYCAAVTMVSLRAFTNAPQRNDPASIQRSITSLRMRSTKLQQLIGACFYLFGFVLFVGLQWAHVTLGHSSTPVGWEILENLTIYFAFAANVFFVFLVLHLVQCFVAGRVDAYASRLNA